MATNFPANPSNGDTHAGFTYSSSVGAWRATAGVSTTLSNTAPSSPSDGDLWWNTNTSKLYISYDDGSSTQWVQAAVPGATGAAGADGSSVTSYANTSAFPSSGNSVGDFAFATNTKAVYIWDGSEWDKISSGSDESPIITTEPPSSHMLSALGSNTSITMVATDPEGFDIEYDIKYNTTGNVLPDQLSSATAIDQANGVFTFIPSSNISNAGSFNARLTASDGNRVTIRTIPISLLFDVINFSPSLGGSSVHEISSNNLIVDAITAQSTGHVGTVYQLTPDTNFTATVHMWGGAGCNDQFLGNVYGGAGGYATADISFIKNQVYTLIVGNGGQSGNRQTYTGYGGFGGGGGSHTELRGSVGPPGTAFSTGGDRTATSRSNVGGGGGGLTGLFLGSTPSQASALLIAGGGGGAAGATDQGRGGNGGGTTGSDGANSTTTLTGGGAGGTQSAGGGTNTTNQDGGAGYGGGAMGRGSGGGSGYYGGEGGGDGGPYQIGMGGGGGSGFYSTNTTHVNNATISGTTPGSGTSRDDPPGTGLSVYAAGVGKPSSSFGEGIFGGGGRFVIMAIQ